jgi:Fic family protein
MSGVLTTDNLSPQLRRQNRINTIHASLAIENNTLSLDQVTDIIDGKPVVGPHRDIQEVHGAIAAYETLERWTPSSLTDLLAAHKLLMTGLVDTPGQLRYCNVEIMQRDKVVHKAPSHRFVSQHMYNLLSWLKDTDEHPLVASCVFHYEFEFIHPFVDGNGRMGRLWQTLILSKWNPLCAFIPVETTVRNRQSEYYASLRQSDVQGESTKFVEFMLMALHGTLNSALAKIYESDQVRDQVSDQVSRLIIALATGDKSASELMKALNLRHAPTFRNNYLAPALTAGIIERTQPSSPRSPTQRYRLTKKGMYWQARL